MQIKVVRKILEANDRISDQLRKMFQEKQILVLNLMSSPGAGKTTLLEATLTDLKEEFNMAVIEGDLQTSNDAERVAATGAQAIQINTEGGCHLDGSMVLDAASELNLDNVDILFVENVGNLVCPAEFSVGEDYKVTILSVVEGDDKPEKYPLIFAESRVMLLNKTDLLPYVDFSLEKASNFARSLNKDINIYPVSAKTREGIDAWYEWLRTEVKNKKQA
ncbi:hydrogenase nickel incorporation protein HypB [Desulfonatronovibrio magnus]|uniref:hydrogenase nickel incorporation protein HypB n=1 Tax=Desulfonatronovibrio magnus TaxID=698827 RepID=UPI0005EB1999|nr:hydrogenase nickel incorporation protein HypB [Desulfonatronovibrio magnus]RQD65495.1 MAG: hydrogenase accessory protein HypB [Desulfonatronovibrio sp. MSAO_Bac4]